MVFNPDPTYAISPQNVGADESDSDADSSGRTAVVALTAGEVNTTLDMGVSLPAQPASIGDTVWFDQDEDGIQDANEGGLPGVKVILYNAQGEILATTFTDSAGHYQFSNLPAGSYQVGFVTPEGLQATLQNQGSDSTDSDLNVDTTFNTSIGRTPLFNLQAGENNHSIDAGFVIDDDKVAGVTTLANLGDLVWNDVNRNGLQDAGEEGIAGVVVYLYDSNGKLVATTTTAADGSDHFMNRVPRGYYGGVQFHALGRITLSTLYDNTTLDADMVPAVTMAPLIQLTGAMSELSIDIGIVITPTGLDEDNEPGAGNRRLYLPLINR